MNELFVSSRNIEVSYPSEWDEMGNNHVAEIGEIMHKCFTGVIDYDMARKLAADVFINRVNKVIKPIFSEKSLDYWGNEALLADSVNFLFESETNKEGIETVSINPKFCIQPLPYVKVGMRWYMGPKDLLSDLTIYEFKEASWRIGKYAETRDDEYLDQIFAVLYQRAGIVGRRKNRSGIFSERGYERSLKAAAHVPTGLKFMVYLFFIGCMNWMRDEPIEIDGVEIRFGCLFPRANNQGGEEKDNDTGMAGVLFQMAESGVFGNMEQTSKVSMWDVFLRLLQIHNQIKETKK